MIIDFIIEDLMLNSYLQKNFHTLVTAMGTAIHGATIRRIPAVNDLINVFHDDRSGFYIIFNDFVIVSEHLLNHIHEIIME
ncbi:hypothetical protein BN3589_01387 [Clostridium sp. C105KSO14]|nr:hypothetical protein BN3589_01387 [Clostridium sp. C105KSO14]